MFEGEGKKGDLMSSRELRNHAPGAGDLIEALKERPELLRKIGQGFTNVELVPFGLSPEALSKPLGKAILHYHRLGKLRSTDRTTLAVNESEPVWLWNGYSGAGAGGDVVYFPTHFHKTDHGGKTKKEILESSKFPGWQMLLTENLSNIPRKGEGKTIGGRAQIEANRTPNEYHALLQSQAYDLETGGTPESWQARVMTHLAQTDGEFIDDYQSGSACNLSAAWFLSSGDVASAFWARGFRKALVGRSDLGRREPDAGARFEVRVY